MGCFLTCFGVEKKRKNLKGRNRSPSREKRYGSYVPLDCEEQVKVDSTGNQVFSNPEVKEESNESTRVKAKKKVSFNLNVKAYEPLENQEEFSSCHSVDKEETEKWDLYCEEDSISSSLLLSYPQNNRYQNCRDGYEEEDDELILEEDDFDLDDIDSDDEELEDYYSDGGNEEALKEDDFPLKLNDVASESCIGDRNQHVLSVLKPIENLSQWKEVKAKSAPVKSLKENVILEKLVKDSSKTTPDLGPFVFGSTRNGCVASTTKRSAAVDASLSNWLETLKNDLK